MKITKFGITKIISECTGVNMMHLVLLTAQKLIQCTDVVFEEIISLTSTFEVFMAFHSINVKAY